MDVHGCLPFVLPVCATAVAALSGDPDTRSATPGTTRAAAAAEQGCQGGVRQGCVRCVVIYSTRWFLAIFVNRYLMMI